MFRNNYEEIYAEENFLGVFLIRVRYPHIAQIIY